MSAFLLMSPVNVKGILSSSTQMYSGSLGTSPKRGFLIKSQRVSAGLIVTDGSPGDGTPSAWRTEEQLESARDRKSTRLNSSHVAISYAVLCMKKKKEEAYDGLQGRM